MRWTLQDWDKRFPVGGKRILNLRYVDDTVLVAISKDEMQELFQRLEKETDHRSFGQGGKNEDQVADLGSHIYSDGSCVPEIKEDNWYGQRRDGSA